MKGSKSGCFFYRRGTLNASNNECFPQSAETRFTAMLEFEKSDAWVAVITKVVLQSENIYIHPIIQICNKLFQFFERN